MNSAETYVDIYENNDNQNNNLERHTVWLSESGAMEFFIFGSSNSYGNGPKNIMSKLTLITGYLPLPPYFSFGFHYSKWEHIDS